MTQTAPPVPITSDAVFSQQLQNLEKSLEKGIDGAVQKFYAQIEPELAGKTPPAASPADTTTTAAASEPVDQKPTAGTWSGTPSPESKPDDAPVSAPTTPPSSGVWPAMNKPKPKPAAAANPSTSGIKPHFGLSDNPTDRSLPWFKHGLRGFLRKIWYGNHPTNPDWTGVKDSFDIYHQIVGDAELFIDQHIHEIVPVGYLKEDTNAAMAELTKSLQNIMKKHVHDGIRLGARYAEYKIKSTPAGKPISADAPPKGSPKPSATRSDDDWEPVNSKQDAIELAAKDLLVNSPLASIPKSQLKEIPDFKAMDKLLSTLGVKLPGVSRIDLAILLMQIVKDMPTGADDKPAVKPKAYVDAPPPSYKIAGEKMDAMPKKHEPWMDPKPEPKPKVEVKPAPKPASKPKPKVEKAKPKEKAKPAAKTHKKPTKKADKPDKKKSKK